MKRAPPGWQLLWTALLAMGCSGDGPDGGSLAAGAASVAGAGGSTGAGGSSGSGGSGGARTPGPLVGEFANTYYWMEDENSYTGPRDTPLPDSKGNPLVTVRGGFAARVCLEGSGRLTDGRIINLFGSGADCTGGFACAEGGGELTCFLLLDPSRYPWGAGSNNNALVPLRSWAVNNLANGRVLYSPDWDGVMIPTVTDTSSNVVGGFAHDGCFRVDDIGYGFGANHADFFAGPKELWQPLESIVRTHARFTVHDGASHCNPSGWNALGGPK